MSDELIPTPASKESCDNAPSANSPSNKHANQPEKELDLAQENKDKESRLGRTEWATFFGDIFVILWIWSDLVVCRDFRKVVFLFASLLVAHLVLCHFISKLLKSVRWGLACWIVLCVPAAWLSYANCKPDEISPPWIEIQTQQGLRGPTPGAEITGQMVELYRQHRLIIQNTNRVDLRNFSARVQLPEPALTSFPAAIAMVPIIPPGVHVSWSPEPSQWSSTATGRGSVTVGPQRPSETWLLGIDALPAFTMIEIPFLTVPRTINVPIPPPFKSRTDAESKDLVDYLLGDFQFLTDEAWRTQDVAIAITFNSTNRTFHTFRARGKWRISQRNVGP